MLRPWRQDRKRSQGPKGKEGWIITVLGLSNAEYREMRKNNFFAMTKNTNDNSFHRKEQQLVFKEIYGKMTKDKVCP
jgi:ribosomal protein L15E